MVKYGNFDNNYVLSKIDENNKEKKLIINKDLQTMFPTVDNNILIKIYDKSISIHQSKKQSNGAFLENNILCDILDKNNILYKKQVTINSAGIIVGFNSKKTNCYHIIDFVIGENIQINSHISEYKVISCKTTCRERWTQDNWSYTLKPKLYILITLSNDYPISSRFRENIQRKIITCIPKTKDDRIYKLGFENLIEELQ
jgi:hypothetical protein